MQYGAAGGMKVMGLRAHPHGRPHCFRALLPVCGLGAALPQATAHAWAPGQTPTNRNNRSQPLLNSHQYPWGMPRTGVKIDFRVSYPAASGHHAGVGEARSRDMSRMVVALILVDQVGVEPIEEIAKRVEKRGAPVGVDCRG